MVSTIPIAEIRFTSDGTDPTALSELYRGPLTLTSAVTLKARLYVNGFPVSEIRTATFTALPPLRLVPSGGRFTNVVEVALVASLPDVQVRYTLDGTMPAATSRLYTEPIRLTGSATIQSRAFLNGFPVTEVVSGLFQRVYAFDNDGIEPAWRTRYFGADYAVDPRAAADADPDEDGTTNRQEFIAGTDPLDKLSGFKVGVRAVPEIRFSSVPGKAYRILRYGAVPGGTASVVAEFTATATETLWVDTDAGVVANPAFYVVQPVP